MIDSVWWYVLAGFLLGFILSTLWEWLYFRRQRMRIENGRIAELEATVRSLSVTSHASESSVSSGMAAGYQSPLVFLEGEEDDGDTVEVIVPAPPEPVNLDQSGADQTVPTQPPYPETPYVEPRPPPSRRTPINNGNGIVREMLTGGPDDGSPGRVETYQVESSKLSVAPAAVAAAVVAATAALVDDKNRPQATPPVTSQTPATQSSPNQNATPQPGTSPANNTGMTESEANHDAQAARQGELNTNSQTGDTTGRGVNNQGVNNPSTTNPSAVPSSPNSATPSSTQPQSNANDQNKPLYERQATDIPWATHSGTDTGNTGTPAPPQ